MAAYASLSDLEARMTRSLTDAEEASVPTLLADAGVMIDAVAPNASTDKKLIVSCRIVMRALGDGTGYGVPVGASQGSMSGLGYSQSWTMSSGGSTGELYLTKADRQLLGVANQIGSYSPTEALVPEASP